MTEKKMAPFGAPKICQCRYQSDDITKMMGLF